LNPARPSTVRNQDGAVTSELNRLYAGGQPATPLRETNKITVGDKKVVLNGQQLSDFERRLGGSYTNHLSELMNSPQYAALNDEQKKNLIDDARLNIREPELLRYLYENKLIDDATVSGQVNKLSNYQLAYLENGIVNVRIPEEKSDGKNVPLGILNGGNSGSINFGNDTKLGKLKLKKSTKGKTGKKIAKVKIAKAPNVKIGSSKLKSVKLKSKKLKLAKLATRKA